MALVGASGSGKSTTLALIQRQRRPDQGRILIDGQDIAQATLASIRDHIAVVAQEGGLFNRSIAENIKLGRPEASQAEVIAANLTSRVRGGGDTHGYDGKVLCFIETSRDRATYAAFNYAEPPRPRAPSRAIHMAKTFYHRLYWSSLRGFP